MKGIARWLSLAALAFVLGAGAVGCNTMQGAGEDLERGGEELEEAAE